MKIYVWRSIAFTAPETGKPHQNISFLSMKSNQLTANNIFIRDEETIHVLFNDLFAAVAAVKGCRKGYAAAHRFTARHTVFLRKNPVVSVLARNKQVFIFDFQSLNQYP
ncbi:MAG: hypothetical protein M3Q06_08570 [Bacteroidota bacterium]|nr:hypothetical protein [Bacteroidota bacterium]